MSALYVFGALYVFVACVFFGVRIQGKWEYSFVDYALSALWPLTLAVAVGVAIAERADA